MKSQYFSGRVHSVIFENESKAFYIVRIVLDAECADNPGGPVTLRGDIPGVRIAVGTWFGFEAVWDDHPQHGKQLKVTRAPVMKSDWDADTSEKVLLSQGIGSTLVASIKKHFGKDMATALLDPIKIQDVPGMTNFTAQHICDKWKSARGHFLTLEFLNDLGLPQGRVRQVWATFGDEAREVLSNDPWSLVQIEGITFEDADTVATRLGLDCSPTNMKRVEGAVLYSTRAGKGFGHLYSSSSDLLVSVKAIDPLISDRDVAVCLRSLSDRKLLVLDRTTLPGTTAIYDTWSHTLEVESARILRERLDTAEISPDRSARYVKALLGEAKDVPLLDAVRETLARIGSAGGMTLSAKQTEGVINALTTPVSVVTGLPGTGKCVVPSTLVSGPWGIAPIGGFLPSGIAPGGTGDLELPLDTSLGVRSSSYVYNGGLQPTIRVHTKSGFQLEGTRVHPIRVIRGGCMTWVPLGDLKIGDIAVLVRGGHAFPSEPPALPVSSKVSNREKHWRFPSHMTHDLARFLGYLVSEGSVVDEGCWSISAHDPKIIQFLRDTMISLFGYTPGPWVDKRVGKEVGIRFGSTEMIRWFRLLGVDPTYADGKSIPSVVLRSPSDFLCCFLGALFEGDGSVCPRDSTAEYSTSSNVLADQVQQVLLHLGIVACRGECIRGGKPYFRLCLYGEDYTKFVDLVGFHFTSMPSRDHKKPNTNKHLLYGIRPLLRDLMSEVKPKKGPDYNLFYRYVMGKNENSRTPSRSHVGKILARFPRGSAVEKIREFMSASYFYDPIVGLDEGTSQVVDFNVPDGHEFLSNGFISHNTTCLRMAMMLLQEAGVSALVIAPTGIAAKRVASVTGVNASTIHRAFKAKGDSDSGREATYAGVVGEGDISTSSDGSDEVWGFGPNNPHPAEVIIVDESSMVDQHILYRILTCTRKEARLVFVGDAAQLPSVGPGNVLRDIIASKKYPTVSLTEIFRQGEASPIIRAAHDIHDGRVPEAPVGTDFSLVPMADEGDIAKALVGLATKLFEKRVNFQVMSPRHSGPVGVTALNTSLREILNPKHSSLQEIRLGSEILREEDRIMVVKNNYKLGVFNGDVGKIVTIDKRAKEVEVKIHGPPVMHIRIPFQQAATLLRLAYAVTVHKMQGQEADVVLMPLVVSFKHQLQRNLLYTAITRARKKVVLLGQHSAMVQAIGNDREGARNTLLLHRLISNGQDPEGV